MTDPMALSLRLERAEARANAASIASRITLSPESGAEWRDIGGVSAAFDGPSSPLTQTFGFGLFAPPSASTLSEIETFYFDRQADVFQEVSPLADLAVLALLSERGYQPIELTSVMFQPLPRSATKAVPATIGARRAGPSEERLWTETAAAGWANTPELEAFLLDFGRVGFHAEGVQCFVAELNGTAVAAAGLAIHDGVAVLAGASTRPEWRNRGAQNALLHARLEHAVTAGCDLAMMCALPGTPSQRNAERQGFRVAYTRIKWRRARQ